MEEKYRKALKEVYEILTKVTKEEYNKIPTKFIDLIKNNMDNDYIPNISYGDNFEKSVLEETLIILALIYRDYIIDSKEREKLLTEEDKLLDKYYEEYSVEKLFNNSNNNDNISTDNNTELNIKENEKTNNQIAIIKEKKWYIKIINKIISFFNRK